MGQRVMIDKLYDAERVRLRDFRIDEVRKNV